MHPIIEEEISSIAKNLESQRNEISEKTFLISGGGGFLGSWFCDVLNFFKSKIICLENFSTSSEKNIQHLLNNNNFKLLKQDVCLPIDLKEPPEFILHMASRPEPKEYIKYPIESLNVNSFGTYNMLELARKHDVKRFLYTSSSEIYGKPPDDLIPTPETFHGIVNPVGVRSCYDEGKRFGEALCMSYNRQYGLPISIVRIFNTYGPRLRGGTYGRAISTFIEQALKNIPVTVFGDGNQTRSFSFVSDTIDGIFRSLLIKKTNDNIFNIGHPEEIKIIELASKIIQLTNSNSRITFFPLPQDDPKRRCPDIKKANKFLSFTPKESLEDGLNKTINWCKHQI